MRLKQLKLAGFKSFANPTIFDFKQTITAIVGPNGCGKSNVIDAIRWVLGESSAKQLRGGAMSDVIFAGTQEKSAKSLASVELVFEHTQADEHGKGGIHHPLNLYHELSVRRQITKDGKSDYFINGTKVRRKDVIDIFLGTGLGARSYAVIEQGMIGRIIDADAKQLREFIEEASGVSRYQSRREETQKQLITAQDNLVRLNDMAGELSQQRDRLEKQAKTAQQAQRYQHQIDEIVAILLQDDYANALQKQQQSLDIHQNFDKQLREKQQILDNLQQQQKQLQQQIYQQQIAQQEQQNLYQLYWQQQHESQTRLQGQQQQQINYENRLLVIDKELDNLNQQQQQVVANAEQMSGQLQSLPQQQAELTDQIQQMKHQQQQLQNQRKQLADELVEINKQKQEYEKQQAVAENNLKNLNNKQQQLQKQQQQYQQNLSNWQSNQQKFVESGDTSEQISVKLQTITDKMEKLEQAILDRQEHLAEQMDEIDSLEQQHRQADKQQQTWQTEQETLQNLLNNQQNIVKNNIDKLNSVDFANMIDDLQLTDIGKAYAKDFDTLAIVFKDWQILANATDNAWSEITQQIAVILPKSASNPQTMAEKSDLINFSQLIAQPKLPIFEHIWFCPCLENMNLLSDFLQNLPMNDWLCVSSTQGLLWINQHYCINLDKLMNQSDNQSNIQRFSQQARIDELEILLQRQQPRLQMLSKQLAEQKIGLQEWQAKDKQQRHELLELSKQKQKLSTEQIRLSSLEDKLADEKQRLDKVEQQWQMEQNSLSNELSENQQYLASIRQQLGNLQPILSEKINQRQQTDKLLSENQQQQQLLQQQQNVVTTQLAKVQLQQQYGEQELQKMIEQSQQLLQEKQSIVEQLANLQSNLPNQQQQLAQMSERLQIVKDDLDEITKKLSLFEQEKMQQLQVFEQYKQTFDELQQQVHTADTNRALATQTLGQILLMIDELKLSLPTDINILSKTERKNIQENQQILKNKLQNLGAVNHTAMSELTEVQQRLEPLAEQIADLTASIDTLQTAMSQIDTQTKELFLTMLNNVNVELNRLFVQVFGGGQASLVLADDEKQGWQSGLELMAQPKGKKNSRLALLSGGEKTLTALSLVFAIFKQQPAPFCVLDEVDAPLDDANVERFSHLIQQLAKEVQFIFISHNKLSMQVADELKGVTMPTAGISRLVNVDMHDVEQYLQSGLS